MKKIYFTLIVLLLAMAGMAYLYFSRLNRENSYNEVSLYAATANSGLVFCVHNDKGVFDILKGQDLFQRLIGEDKSAQFSLLKNAVISNPSVNKLIANRNIFISFSAGKNKTIDYLICTQLNNEQDKPALINTLISNGFKASNDSGLIKLTIKDSISFYLGMEKNLVLLSGSAAPVRSALTASPSKSTKEFIAYIKLNNKLSQNSAGNIFIDFNKIPALMRSVLPGVLNGSLAMFEHQDSFAALNYNFSTERLFFTGNTKLNDTSNYLSLFAGLTPEKNSIDNMLPQNTANYRLFSIPDYKSWRTLLNTWFKQHREDTEVKKIIAHTDQLYHLNAEEIFPQYFKDQLISFQLRSAENMGAVNLTNGDKVKQLLIDISEDYDQDIKKFKLSGLLYAYFGEPFKKFSSPYYTIIDNYMVFANQPRSLQVFLSAYRNNKLLINTPDYISLYAQISNSASITFYVNHDNSSDLVRNNIYTGYYKHFLSDKGLGKFSSLIYQLNGDKGSYQTNLLINTSAEINKENIIDTIPGVLPVKPL
jgi:hypothetical protein